ncbi:MAG: hypothetical protein AB2421_00885 [Thermotaleaceae bacterium]
MRKAGAVFLVVIFIGVFIIGCAPKTDEEIYYQSQKLLNKIDSYHCTVRIKVFGNRDPQEYRMIQWFRNPDQYKLEIIEPESLKGNITLSDGKRAWIYHPGIEETWMMEDFRNSEKQNMFLGYFIKNCLESEDAILSREKLNNEEYLLIETSIPGNHAYFNKEKLWFHIEDLKPYKLQVIDIKEQVRIQVWYEDFEYNPKLDENFFHISGNGRSE